MSRPPRPAPLGAPGSALAVALFAPAAGVRAPARRPAGCRKPAAGRAAATTTSPGPRRSARAPDRVRRRAASADPRPHRPAAARRCARSRGAPWLHVRLPGRPNGHTGWIPAAPDPAHLDRWEIVVNSPRAASPSSTRAAPSAGSRRRRQALDADPARAVLRRGGRRARPGAAGGPFALATSARSHVLQEFEGGPGQIALHGTDSLSGALGTAVSHGCVRLSTRPSRGWRGASAPASR